VEELALLEALAIAVQVVAVVRLPFLDGQLVHAGEHLGLGFRAKAKVRVG